MQQIRSILIYTLFITISLPIFIQVDNGVSLYSGIWLRSSGITLPISIIPAILLFISIILKPNQLNSISTSKLLIILPILYIVVNTASLLVGFIIGVPPQASLFYIQTILPLLYWFISLDISTTIKSINHFYRILISVASLACWGLIFQNTYESSWSETVKGRSVDYIGPFYIWGIYDYFPLVMAFIAILGIALFITFNTGWRVFLFATVPTIFTIPLLWSKGAIVTFGLGFILTIIFVIVKFGWTHRLLTICIGSILLVAVIFLSPSQPLVVQRFVADFITGESTSLTSRMSRWDSALLIITSNPWFGISFDPSFDIGDDIGINRVFRSHNQYIDIWLKSGSISLLLFIIVLSVLVFRLFMRYKSHLEFLPEFGISVGLLSAWISTITVSNMSQVNFNQLYSAGILWFSIGLFEGYYIHKHKRI